MARLAIKYFVMKPPKQRFPRISIVYTVSMINTCIIMAITEIGGVWAAAPFGIFMIYDFPIPRAVYLAFLAVFGMRIGLHETILALSAFVIEFALSVIFMIGL